VAETVVVHEVGLRDGLQNQPRLVPLESKLAMLDALIEAGCRSIEATSFVSPKAVPQMADAAELYARLPRDAGINFEALVPNERGYERAVECGVNVNGFPLSVFDVEPMPEPKIKSRPVNFSPVQMQFVSFKPGQTGIKPIDKAGWWANEPVKWPFGKSQCIFLIGNPCQLVGALAGKTEAGKSSVF